MIMSINTITSLPEAIEGLFRTSHASQRCENINPDFFGKKHM